MNTKVKIAKLLQKYKRKNVYIILQHVLCNRSLSETFVASKELNLIASKTNLKISKRLVNSLEVPYMRGEHLSIAVKHSSEKFIKGLEVYDR